MALGGPGGSRAYPGRHEKVASAPGRYSGSVVVTLPCARKGAKQRSSSKAREELVTKGKHEDRLRDLILGTWAKFGCWSALHGLFLRWWSYTI